MAWLLTVARADTLQDADRNDATLAPLNTKTGGC
jgi:hypothetical protein